MAQTAGHRTLPVALLLANALLGQPTLAQAPAAPTQAPAAPTPAETEEEKRERETRTACAAAVCSTLHNHTPDSGQVSCAVTKTWRKEVLGKILAEAKLTWPWGYARCTTDVKLDRGMLVKAMVDAEVEVRLDTHDITCEI